MKYSQRRRIGEARMKEVMTLAAQEKGITVGILNPWPLHVRVYGVNRVDYWPTTGKAWLFESEASAAFRSPSEVIALAGTPRGDVPEGDGAVAGGGDGLTEEQREHLRSI